MDLAPRFRPGAGSEDGDDDDDVPPGRGDLLSESEVR